MPWIKHGDKVFDLEIEKTSNTNELIDFLEQAFFGEEFVDKYGNILKLKTIQDKKEFAYQLSMSKIFNTYVDRFFDVNEKRLLDILLNYD